MALPQTPSRYGRKGFGIGKEGDGIGTKDGWERVGGTGKEKERGIKREEGGGECNVS